MSTAVFIPNRTSLCIMQLVHGYFSKTRKPWTLMSQKWILEHLDRWYGVRISRSTLNYNLRILREEGLIETTTRHIRDPRTGNFVPRVTLYKASSKLKKFFSGLAKYFKRCGWVPDVKALRAGHVPVVGEATTKERAFQSCLEEQRREKKGHRGASTPGARKQKKGFFPPDAVLDDLFFAKWQRGRV